MNGGPVQKEVVGTVARIDSSGIGLNSGEMTLVIAPEGGGGVVLVFAGIMDDNHGPHGIEHGVYASYFSMAIAAMTTGRKLTVSYIVADKPRVYGMSLIA